MHVPAYNHELKEGLPHPWIFKGSRSHFERGWGTWNIDMHNDDRQMTQRSSDLFRIHRGHSALSIVLKKNWQ